MARTPLEWRTTDQVKRVARSARIEVSASPLAASALSSWLTTKMRNICSLVGRRSAPRAELQIACVNHVPGRASPAGLVLQGAADWSH